MSWKRNLMESFVWAASRFAPTTPEVPDPPSSIFVLRNNNIGDLLIITPLFEALRRRFPEARIVAGVGSWNVDVLNGNPHVSEIVAVNAPWHNSYAPTGFRRAVSYLLRSQEIEQLRSRSFDIGIDILGSYWGSLLMLRCGIPYRLGVRGFGGGHTAVQKYVQYDEGKQVGRAALEFAELLGASSLPEARPQIFLSPEESEQGESLWSFAPRSSGFRRIVVAPGGGFLEKCWPLEHFRAVGESLGAAGGTAMAIVGSGQDRDAGAALADGSPFACNLTGRLDLRQTFALVSRADLVICNSSMIMHAAAAFRVPSVVLLGPYFSSARRHAAQWGYPDCCILGKDDGRREIYSPAEALEVIRSMTSQSELTV